MSPESNNRLSGQLPKGTRWGPDYRYKHTHFAPVCHSLSSATHIGLAQMQPALSGIAPIAIVKNFNHRLPMCLSHSLYCLCSVLLSRNLVIIIKWCLCNLPLLWAVHLSKIHTSSNHRLPVTSMFPSYIHTSSYHTICLWLSVFSSYHPNITYFACDW